MLGSAFWHPFFCIYAMPNEYLFFLFYHIEGLAEHFYTLKTFGGFPWPRFLQPVPTISRSWYNFYSLKVAKPFGMIFFLMNFAIFVLHNLIWVICFLFQGGIHCRIIFPVGLYLVWTSLHDVFQGRMNGYAADPYAQVPSETPAVVTVQDGGYRIVKHKSPSGRQIWQPPGFVTGSAGWYGEGAAVEAAAPSAAPEQQVCRSDSILLYCN